VGHGEASRRGCRVGCCGGLRERQPPSEARGRRELIISAISPGEKTAWAEGRSASREAGSAIARRSFPRRVPAFCRPRNRPRGGREGGGPHHDRASEMPKGRSIILAMAIGVGREWALSHSLRETDFSSCGALCRSSLTHLLTRQARFTCRILAIKLRPKRSSEKGRTLTFVVEL
jgi:hypothetical protein